jgi:hypothetical protein
MTAARNAFTSVRRVASTFGLVAYFLATVAGFCADSRAIAPDLRERAVELSPFVVREESNQGYYASQTLAGGRLRQNIEDLGASIQVVTREMLDDLGVTGVEELFQFTTNTEVGGILGNFTGATDNSGGDVGTGDARRNPDGTTRVRGLAAPDRARNFFKTDIPFDSYNTDRVDINRGANSFLFGLGSPAACSGSSNFLVAPLRFAPGHALRDGRAKEPMAIDDFVDRLVEDFRRGMLLQNTRHANCGHALDIFVIGVRGENDHFSRGVGRENLARRMEAVEHRHRDVYENDIGPKSRRHLHRLATIPRLHNVEMAPDPQQPAQTQAHHRVVIRQQDGDFLHPPPLQEQPK